MSINKPADRTNASKLANMLEGLDFISDKPKEKENEEEIVKETEPETQTIPLSKS